MAVVPTPTPRSADPVSAALRVLVYGSIGDGVCDVYRLGMYQDRLATLGVEVRTWGDFNDYEIRIPATYADRLDDALHDGVAEVDPTPIEWADVIVFRRWYSVAPSCEACDTTGTESAIDAHAVLSGHPRNTPDRLLPLLLDTLERDPGTRSRPAIVYETDDDLLSGEPWLPFARRLVPDRPVIERMLRGADLVTVTTPVLRATAGRYNDAVRVIRNAIDPAWYAPAPAVAESSTPGDPRILYYGAAARVRDYEVCRGPLDEAVRRYPDARRIWLGSDEPSVARLVDEAHPYVESVPAFARRLAELRPDIGLAPVMGDRYARARSELHWLEYTMAGAATIASRSMGGGPYDVIRDGVDGILARNGAAWRDGLARLIGSPDLRAELNGRAHERVLAEYTADDRAAEWADAFRWAAEHSGRVR